jgi:hypothetical protein
MMMIGDIVNFFQGVATLARCSRRNCSKRDLFSAADSVTDFVESKPKEAPAHHDLSNLSTDGSNTSGSADNSDAESTTAGSDGSGESATALETNASDSCLNRWAQPFVPAAQAPGNYHVRSGNTPLRTEADVHANLANVISRLSREDAATVSAFLELKLAKAGKKATDPSLQVGQEDPLVDHGHYPVGGFKLPPGLSEDPPKPTVHLRAPLLPGLVVPKDRVGPSKYDVTQEVKDNNLRSNLNKLSQYDPACIFLVRKVNKLGLNSADFLKAYFSTLGKVDCVMVSHSIEKPIPGRRKPRVRPAGLAFVIMDSAEDVVSILRLGSEHVVHGVSVCASIYEPQQRTEIEAGAFEE